MLDWPQPQTFIQWRKPCDCEPGLNFCRRSNSNHLPELSWFCRIRLYRVFVVQTGFFGTILFFSWTFIVPTDQLNSDHWITDFFNLIFCFNHTFQEILHFCFFQPGGWTAVKNTLALWDLDWNFLFKINILRQMILVRNGAELNTCFRWWT